MSPSSTRCRSSLVVALFVALVPAAQAATQFYPTNNDLNPAVSGWKLLKRGSNGDGIQTTTSNTTTGPVSDTQVPVTETQGGSQLKWLSEPVAAVTLAGNQSVNLKDAQQSSASVNSQVVCWVYRYDESTDSVETGTGNKVTMGAELTGSQADYTLGPVNPFWDPALANGDRVALVCYLDDAPSVTMGTGSVSFEYDQSATEYTTLQVAEDLTDAPAAGGWHFIDVSALWGWLAPASAFAACITRATVECDAPAWRCLNAATTSEQRAACQKEQQACTSRTSRECLTPATAPTIAPVQAGGRSVR